MQSNMNCTICESRHVDIKFNITAEKQVCSCLDCGVEFLFPQLDDSDLKKLYSENYYLAWGVSGNGENESTKKMKCATFELRLALISKYIQSGNNL